MSETLRHRRDASGAAPRGKRREAGAVDQISVASPEPVAAERRLLVLSPRLAGDDELGPWSRSEGWILELLSRGHPMVLAVDHRSLASERVRVLGVPVVVSPRRWIPDSDGGRQRGEATVAAQLHCLHQEAPFFSIVDTRGAGTHPAWYEPELAAVPWVAAELEPRRGRRGLEDALHRGWLADADAALALDRPGPDRPARPEPGEDQWIGVTALGASRSELWQAMPRLERLPSSCVVVLVADPSDGSLVAGWASPSLRERLVVAPADCDGVAAALLGECDQHWELGDERLGWAPPGRSFEELVVGRSTAARRCDLWLARFEDGPTQVGQQISDAEALAGPHDLLLLHAEEPIAELARIGYLRRLTGSDLVLWAEPNGPFDEPDTGQLWCNLLAVRRPWWPLVREALSGGASLVDLVRWGLEGALGGELSCRVLPRLSETESTVRAPFCPTLEAPPPAGEADGVRRWAERNRWYDRVRLGLPWRFGALERGMRGLW